MSSTANGPNAQGSASSELFPPPDDRLLSLCSLLSRPPSASAQHLALLDPSTVHRSIAYYLATLPASDVALFASIVVRSPVLWDRDAARLQMRGRKGGDDVGETRKGEWSEGEDTLTGADIDPLFVRAQSISSALASAVLHRISLVIRSLDGSTGLRARIRLSEWTSAVLSSVDDAPEQSFTVPSTSTFSSVVRDPMPPASPLAKTVLATGLLAGLQEAKRRKAESRSKAGVFAVGEGVGVRRPLTRAEDVWVKCFGEAICTASGSSADAAEARTADEWEKEFDNRSNLPHRDLGRKQDLTTALYLGSQVFLSVPDSKLDILPVETVVAASAGAIFETLQDGTFLDDLSAETTRAVDGKVDLPPTSTTARRIDAIMKRPLYATLGPLSRILSNALARLASMLSPIDFERRCAPILRRMRNAAERVEGAWERSELCGAGDELLADACRQQTTRLWQLLKTQLFSYTMIAESLVDAIVDLCPATVVASFSSFSPDSSAAATDLSAPTSTAFTGDPPRAALKPRGVRPSDQRKHRLSRTSGSRGSTTSSTPLRTISTTPIPPPYLAIILHLLTTFSHLYFVTSTFGPDGFDVYSKVFYSALDIVCRDEEACVALEGPRGGCADDDWDGFGGEIGVGPQEKELGRLEHNPVARARATYYLNVAEQISASLPDEVIEESLLMACKPYLEDPRYTDAFESAHSAVLSLFANRKSIAIELAPWYIGLLCKSFPGLLREAQLHHAYPVVVSALAERDEAVAWLAVVRLAEEIEREGGGLVGAITVAGRQDGSRLEEAEGEKEEKLEQKQEQSSFSDNTSVTPSPSDAPSSPPPSASRHSTPGSSESPDPSPRLRALLHLLPLLIPCVSSTLLPSLLSLVRATILSIPEKSDERKEMVERSFEEIDCALDAGLKEVGVRWWAEVREELMGSAEA